MRPRSSLAAAAQRTSVVLVLAMAVVMAVAPVATASTSTTTLSANATQLSPNQQVTLSATVTASTGSTPGTVNFMANGPTISGCGAVAVSNGQATCTTSFSEPGIHGLQAGYSGDYTYGSWSTSNQVNVTQSGVASSVKLSSLSSFPTTGLTFILMAAVAGSAGDNTPFQGAVEFLDGGTPVSGCTASAVSTTDQAECQLSFATAGTHSIVAMYLGGSDWSPSSSAPLVLTIPQAGSSQMAPCAGQDQVLHAADLTAARGAMLCLINHVRGRYGLDPLSESPTLDAHAQTHPGQAWAPPGVRLYGGSMLFDGYGPDTPYAVIAAWMRGRMSCADLLSPLTEAGFGAVNHPVITTPPFGGVPAFGYAPAWIALMFATSPGSFNQPATGTCPHPLPEDAAGQGKPPSAHQPITDLLVATAAHHGPAIVLELIGQVSPFAAHLTVTVPGGASRTVQVHGPNRPHRLNLRVRFGADALRGATRNSIVRVLVTETAPKPSTYLFELRL
jgi:uncharacterized protein YkwD